VVIAPSRRLDGTNALFLRPPGLIPFAFGPGSLEQHQQAARAMGLEPVIYRSPTTALDLDVPMDLEAWRKRNEATNLA
jgi:2-phospho-L-lactate guanylyltransferase